MSQLLQAILDQNSVEKKVIALAALTGLRQGELLSLEASNVHDGRILLRPDQTKSGKTRVVPVPEDARAWLEELPFATSYHRLLTVWEKARVAVGRPDLHFHDLRHSYASMLAQAGESMTTVRDLLGHSSLIVTSRYAHMFDAGLDDIAARLPRLNAAICDQALRRGATDEKKPLSA
ncbi:site-specific integrase [Halomonas salifodinae]|uniref:Site-specific integrase n=1 Tax=Halomonas salifodinae TaxID=438745 RepID=A0ABW2EQR0_9GAMM